MNEKIYKGYISQFENAKMKFHKRVKEIEQNKLNRNNKKRKISSRKNKRTRNKSNKFIKE